MRIVDGVLFAENDGTKGADSQDEAVLLHRDLDVLSHAGKGSSVWRVAGESAVPVAMDGQYLLVRRPVSSREDLEHLNGRMIFAEVDGPESEPERYFKRMRLTLEMVVLESIERTGQSPPIVCALGSDKRFPRLLSAAPVRGVLFKCQA